MGVAERDRIWTEWARHQWRNLARDLRELEQRWTTVPLAGPRDSLRARWAMWLLTSTVPDLRDQATRTLYWFGRRWPSGLFGLALDSLEINDPYVSERTMAAAYGMVMAHQLPDDDFGAALRQFLIGVRDALIDPEAARPTNDWLVRLYVQGTFRLAAVYYPGTLPEELPEGTELEFRSSPTAEPIAEDDPREDEVSRTLHMDFENYTVGRLVEDRANYDHSHPQYQQVLAEIKGTIWSLGWRKSTFGNIDSTIADESYPRRERSGNAERYGKKYSWIGFYAAAGRLQERGELKPASERLSDLGIDPSFPSHLPPLPIALPDWAQPTPASLEDWVIGGEVTVPAELLQPSALDGYPGPWIVVGGYLETNMQAPGRRVWGILNAVLIDKGDAAKATAAFATRNYPGRHWIPEAPEDYYTFAGEIPWHPTFAHIHEEDDPYDPYRTVLRFDEGVTASVPVEVIAHRFTWEGYHSALNDVGSVLVPSKEISCALDLRAGPQLFHQFDSSGAAASLSYGPPPRMTGHLLYMRHDVLRDYAQGRDLVLLWWGERLPRPYSSDQPEWLVQARQVHKEVWRIVRRIDLNCG